MLNKLRKYIPPFGWWYFSKTIKRHGQRLLPHLKDFKGVVLVTGCQRSGTTVVRRALSQSEEMSEFWSEKDDELEGARILAGTMPFEPKGRYCFQTTYLNEFYKEYFDQAKPFKIVWVMREPKAVVRSMLYNWKQFPLNELFNACGINELLPQDMRRYKYFGIYGISPLKRACYAYNGKLSQLADLSKRLGADKLYVIDYNDIVKNPERLKKLYQFADLEYKENYFSIFGRPEPSGKDGLTEKQSETVLSLCGSQYDDALKYLSDS